MQNRKSIQLIEPDEVAANNIINVLERKGYLVDRYISGRAAIKYSKHSITLISSNVNDITIPDWIREHKQDAHAAIAIIGQDEGMLAADAMKVGATDYLLRPFESTQLLSLIERVEALEKPLSNIVAESWMSKQLLQLAHRAARTDASVLISGESGTGKEVLAQYIHNHSTRADKPFVAVNCAAIPESMLEAVLFGHIKGAFTGAVQSQTGKFEEANGGTILLDEISEMSPALQAKLLRVLQEHEVEKIGSHKMIQLDIRVIAITNRDLRKEVQSGTFREDLYYRLDVLPLHWAPLRERPDDILPLANFFITKYQNKARCRLADDAITALTQYHWPGNIRELENVIQRALVMRHGDFIVAQDLMLSDKATVTKKPETSMKGMHYVDAKKMAEFNFIIETLKKFGGNRTKTAEMLGMSTRALRYKIVAIREHGIDLESAIYSVA